MSLEELQDKMLRNNRFISLCINSSIVFDSNVELTDTKWKIYKESCKNYADFLRNMVADNIKSEDIAEKFNVEKQDLLKILIENHWIQNINDFPMED